MYYVRMCIYNKFSCCLYICVYQNAVNIQFCSSRSIMTIVLWRTKSITTTVQTISIITSLRQQLTLVYYYNQSSSKKILDAPEHKRETRGSSTSACNPSKCPYSEDNMTHQTGQPDWCCVSQIQSIIRQKWCTP